jgi:hypothetical protein
MGLLVFVSAEITCDGADALQDGCANDHKDPAIDCTAHSVTQARTGAITQAQKAGWICRDNRWLCPSCAK